jgi:uncharacterized protein (DUF433 family)
MVRTGQKDVIFMRKKTRQIPRTSRRVAGSAVTSVADPRNTKVSKNGQAIVKTPGICGGHPRVAGTRIPVWLLEFEKRLGIAESKILKRHPTLSRDALRDALKYAVDHSDEIEKQIRKNEGR